MVAPGAHDARPGPRPRRSSRSAPTASPARSPPPTEPGPGLRARLGRLHGLDRPLARRSTSRGSRGRDYRTRLIAAGMYTTTPERLLGTQFLGAVGARVPRGSSLTGARRRSGVARRSRHRRSGVLGWVLPDVHRRLARAEAPRADRARSARPDRPPRRDARGRPQLPAVAAARRDEDQGAALVRGPADAAGAEHGPHARRGAREPPRARRHAGRADVLALDRPGRDDGRLDGPDHAEPRDRAPQAPAGLRGGARPEGAGEDPLPDPVPDHAGALHRASSCR